MSTRKANIIKIIVCVIMACVLLVGSIVMSYAQETEVTNPYNLEYWTDAEESEYWENLFPLFVLDQIGLISTHDLLESAYDNFVDIVDGLSVDANISYDDWIGAHFYLNPKEGVNIQEQLPNDLTVSYYTVDETMVNVVNQAVQETLAENPLGYIDVVIQNGGNVNSSLSWNNYGQYKSFVDWCKNQDGYILVKGSLPNSVYMVVVPFSVDFGMYGTVTGGQFTSVDFAVNWVENTRPWQIDSKVKLYSMNNNGVISEFTGNNAVDKLLNNTGIGGNQSSTTYTIYTSGNKNRHDYVFANLNAYKAFNSGKPQSYYYGENGIQYPTGSITSSNVNTSSVSDAYNQVTNNITSGMSAQDVIELVDTILDHYNSSSGGSGGSGSGGGHVIDFSSISALLASIGNLIGSLIIGLAEGLTNIVNAINNVITSIRENLTQGIIFEWLTELIAWLPVEIRTLVIALFTLTVIFACIKLVKGIL